jgi:hypothetical protein
MHAILSTVDIPFEIHNDDPQNCLIYTSILHFQVGLFEFRIHITGWKASKSITVATYLKLCFLIQHNYIVSNTTKLVLR